MTGADGAAAGFGPSHTHYGESATNGNYRQMAQWAPVWATAPIFPRRATWQLILKGKNK